MKRLFLFLIAAFVFFPSTAQDERLRIAVFDPTSSGTSIDEGTKIAIRELISSTIVNTGRHSIVERSLLEKVMQEQSFSNSGAVDDSQMTEIGKLAGANKIIVSVVTLTGGRNMLSVKMIDVMTANVERQKVKIVTSGELLDIVEPMTLELIGEAGGQAYDSGVCETVAVSPSDAGTADSPVSQEVLIPAEDEVILYLPAGYEPKKEKDRDLLVPVILDRKLIGSGTLSGGFLLRIKKPEPGKKMHVLNVGGNTIVGTGYRMKFDTLEHNYYEFQVYRWNYLGKAMYGVSLKEAKTIK